MFANGSDFKQDFTTLLNDFNIKPVLTLVNNPQANAPVERVHQEIFNMLVTKDLDDKFFGCIDPLGETLTYYSNILATPSQAVFVRDILFNLWSIVEWQVTTAAKQRQVDLDNIRVNDKRVTHDCAIGDRVYVEITGIYRKLYYDKIVVCRITEVL